MSSSHTFAVKGMHCASCAINIEKTFKQTPGVKSAHVNYGTETAQIDFDETTTSASALSKQIEPLGYTLVVPAPTHDATHATNASKQDKLADIANMRTMVLSVLPLAIVSIAVMTWDVLAQFGVVAMPAVVLKEFFHHLLPIFATYTLFVVGKPYLMGVYRFVRYGKANMDTLVGIGTSAAFLYSFILSAFEEVLQPYLDVSHTYYDVTIVVIAFITLGKYLEARAKLKTGDAIEALLNLQAKTALVLRDGEELEIPADQVKVGDSVRIKPGAHIPVDGVLTEGASYVDESMVTGESMPMEKTVGDTVRAGTLNTSGAFTFTATSVGSETTLANIIAMVEAAQGSRAPIQALADKISAVFVPVVLVLSVIALAAWLIVGIPALGLSQAVSYGLTSFVGILVIACPCALGLATPTAIIVGVGKGAKEGILLKDAATLEKLHGIDTLVVDKTGTITQGAPQYVGMRTYAEQSEKEVIGIVASLEQHSEHPIAQAITAYAKSKNMRLASVKKFESIKGKGIRGEVAGVTYHVGNAKLMKDARVSMQTLQRDIEQATTQGQTPLVLATDERVVAVLFVADALKPEAAQAVQDIRALGIRLIMATGDTKRTAQAIAKQVGIDDVMAEVLPQDKLALIKDLQSKGHVVAMAGDGVNDAPALAQADVGIAMSTGTDVAIQTAGITLLSGDLSKLVKAIRLSNITMAGIKQNLFWAFIYNVIGIPLAAGLLFPFFGWLLNPVFAGMAMAFSSVSVIANSLRLKTKKI